MSIEKRDSPGLIEDLEAFLKNPTAHEFNYALPKEPNYVIPYGGHELNELFHEIVYRQQEELVATLQNFEEEGKTPTGFSIKYKNDIAGNRMFTQLSTETNIPTVLLYDKQSIKPSSLKFLVYSNPAFDPINKALPFEMNAQLVVSGIHTDKETSKQASEALGKPLLHFHPETKYILHSDKKRRRLFKVSAIPLETTDSREDLIPDDHSTRFVFSPYDKNDSAILGEYLRYLNNKIKS